MMTPWDVEWRDEVVAGSPVVKDGYLEIPNRPGLGVELVHSELAKHPFEEKSMQMFDNKD